ncbi:vomeronasal 1 receptor cavPorV1R615 [Cavia porcellus]|uniref:vomeronasal 1 receptor cavPorV1R615 n=1 Tax=Cavia porcellus TaxID=10141 RepID=UPI0001CF7403|nr:vomeronasal 1 receptor cavPorV1R615 [Cavia porcellus]
MSSMDLKLVILFLFPVVIGSLGNLILLYHFLCLYCRGGRSRSMDVILMQLTVANSLFILSRGIPQILEAFEIEVFITTLGCKLLFYVYRVARGASFSITCLLSVFQEIIISPKSSKFAKLKAKTLKYIGPCAIICWVLQMLLNIRVPMLVREKRNSENISNTIDFHYCSVMSSDKEKSSIFVVLELSHDVLCLRLMIWSTGSMVLILNRHKQRTQHIHRQNSSSRSSPETRASQSILLLVCAFVSFHALSFITNLWFSLYYRYSWWLVKTSDLTYWCFPTVSPFIFMTREQCVCRSMWKK